DAALARATETAIELRQRNADELANTLLPWLGDQPSGPRSSRRLMGALAGMSAPSALAGWGWIVRRRPRDDLVIRRAAWATDELWVVSGRLATGLGFAALYAPLQWELSELEVPATRAFTGATGSLERQIGLVAGSEGFVLRTDADGLTTSRIHGAPDLSAAAL